MRTSWVVLGVCALTLSCGSSSSGAAAEAPAGSAGSGGTGGAAAGSGLNGCADADFKDVSAGTDDDRMVMVASDKNAFTQRCMTIKASQAVMFMADFTVHPLMPGVAPSRSGDKGATLPNPIQPTMSGDQVSFTFPTPGAYPYYCSAHEAQGMYGVVKVIPDTGGAGGGSGAGGGGTGGSNGGTGGASGGAAGAGGDSAGSAGMAMSASLNNCAEANYKDMSAPAANRMIMVVTGKTAFDMPCMEIAAGQSVMFMWPYTTHPLMPGIAPSHPNDTGATEPSPIPMKTSGSNASFKFPAPGYYPYYCAKDEASGMMGVVKVK